MLSLPGRAHTLRARTRRPAESLDGPRDVRKRSVSVHQLEFRRALPDDEPRLQEIRARAFEPVFASFRAIMGDELYDLAQRRDDEAQSALLSGLLAGNQGFEVFVAHRGSEAVGFVALRVNRETLVGEIGLNAVDPAHARRGIGTRMYEFAANRLREEGMKAAVVGTGGDASHAPARRAYRKAGFRVEVPSVWMFRKL